MPDPALGSNAVVALDFESSWNTPKTSSKLARKIPIVRNSLTGTQEFLTNPALRGDFNPLAPTSGKKAASGSMVVIPTVEVTPLITKWLTGVLTYAAGPPKTHTSLLGSTMPASCVVETDILGSHGGTPTHRYSYATGVRINRLGINIDPAGFLQFALDLAAADVTIETASYDTPDDWTTYTPLEMLQLAAADVKVDAAACGYIAGGNLDINANLYTDDYRVGAGGARGSLVPGRYTIGGSLRIVLDDTDQIDMLAAGANHSIDLTWTAGTNKLFQIFLPQITFQKVQPTLNDAGPMIVDAQFQASYEAVTTSAIKFVTTNDKADTAYA